MIDEPVANWEITPILAGSLDGSERGNLTLKRHMGESTTVACIVWLLRGPRGTVIVDAGPGDPEEIRALSGRELRRPAPLTSALAEYGVRADEIGTVVLTHLHWDHSGGLDLFPAAEVLVQRAELEWAIAPLPPQPPLYEWSRPPSELPRWLHARPRMRPLDGDHVIAPGLTAVDLGGHTPGSQGVLVETARGRCLIAGDAVPTYENLRDDVPTGWYVDLRRTHATMRRIRELQAVVLPSHDPAVLDAEVVTR